MHAKNWTCPGPKRKRSVADQPLVLYAILERSSHSITASRRDGVLERVTWDLKRVAESGQAGGEWRAAGRLCNRDGPPSHSYQHSETPLKQAPIGRGVWRLRARQSLLTCLFGRSIFLGLQAFDRPLFHRAKCAGSLKWPMELELVSWSFPFSWQRETRISCEQLRHP